MWLPKSPLLSRRLAVRLHPSVHRRFQRIVDRQGVPASVFIRAMIDQLFSTPSPKSALAAMDQAQSQYTQARAVLRKLQKLAPDSTDGASAQMPTGNVRLGGQPRQLLNSLSMEFDRPGHLILAEALQQHVLPTRADSSGQDGYVWCGLCEHAYPRTDIVPDHLADRDDTGRLMRCPTLDCYGDPDRDGVDWSQVREMRPEYPRVPDLEAHYPAGRLPR